MRHDERARVIEMLADRAVQLVKFSLVSQPEFEDRRAHAARQVKADRAAGVVGPVDARPRLDPMSCRPASRYSWVRQRPMSRSAPFGLNAAWKIWPSRVQAG
jgi:hypothetical protein